MILSVALPRINPMMTSAVIEAVYPSEGGALQLGEKFLDVKVDLSVAVPHDCPPISFYRISMRERVWLCKILVSPGQEVPVDAPLGIFSVESGGDISMAAERAARVSIVGILPHSGWWS